MKSNLLLVEDHEMLRISLANELREAGFQVDDVINGQEALKNLEGKTYTVVITDLSLPGHLNGIEILEKVKRDSPETVVLVITAFGSIETAVEAMKKGAEDYLTKPFEVEELLIILSRAIKLRNLEKENIKLRKRLGRLYQFDNFIGISEPIKRIKETLGTVAPTDETILIEGETGTGKEVLAHFIHENSKRHSGPFEAVSCASLPAELLETELFGHEKGAFTGAYQRKIGVFESASGGTILLDEVDDIPVGLQVKLLRVLQEREFQRIGGSEKIKADIRVIAATKENLQELIAQKQFRTDLYYRLNVIPIFIPPLRERREDIVPLVEHILMKSCPDFDKIDVEPDALQCMIEFNWPGNVRQLENMLKRIVLMGQCPYISRDMIPKEISENITREKSIAWKKMNYSTAMDDFECQILSQALKQADGNKSRAADLLKMKASTFRDRLTKHGLM